MGVSLSLLGELSLGTFPVVRMFAVFVDVTTPDWRKKLLNMNSNERDSLFQTTPAFVIGQSFR
jgi:hypothetical protein